MFYCIISEIFDCGSVAYAVPALVSCLPAWFRFAQCLRRYRDTRLLFPHIVNAGKYSTTFFVVLFSSLNSHYISKSWKIFTNTMSVKIAVHSYISIHMFVSSYLFVFMCLTSVSLCLTSVTVSYQCLTVSYQCHCVLPVSHCVLPVSLCLTSVSLCLTSVTVSYQCLTVSCSCLASHFVETCLFMYKDMPQDFTQSNPFLYFCVSLVSHCV